MSVLASRSGHIELDRPTESVTVGQRHRCDLGDLTELIDSIRDLGMLQPITISPDGTLICGARRLAAVKQLGLRRINVWVRAGISSALQRLLAESHDNTVRKPFSPAEAAGLYQELKLLMAEDASRRQQATQFGANLGAVHGAADSAAPPDRTSRAKAARLVTGRKSYTRLEQIGQLQGLAVDPTTPAAIRDIANQALHRIEVDGTVNGHYQRVKTAQDAMNQRQMAQDTASSGRSRSNRTAPTATTNAGEAVAEAGRRRGRVRAFVLTLGELSGWTADQDPAEIGPALNETQWTDFQAVVTATVAFVDAAGHARQT